MLERLFEYFIARPGVTFHTFDEIADDFRRDLRHGAALATARTS